MSSVNTDIAEPSNQMKPKFRINIPSDETVRASSRVVAHTIVGARSQETLVQLRNLNPVRWKVDALAEVQLEVATRVWAQSA